MKGKRKYRTIEMLLRIVTAIILIQTLHFKFSGHPQAIHIFSTIGMEPWGRYGIGAIELITGILFFLPNYWKYCCCNNSGFNGWSYRFSFIYAFRDCSLNTMEWKMVESYLRWLSLHWFLVAF